MSENRKNAVGILPPCRWAACVSLLLLLVVATGCSQLFRRSSKADYQVKAIYLGSNKLDSVTHGVLEARVMRFADEYVALVAQAADDFSARVATPEARLAGLRWKLGQATSAYTDATGPNPALNALDMLVLVTLSRMVVEDYLLGEVFGDAALPLLETHRRIESSAWSLASGVLKQEQQRELRELIEEWRQKNPTQRYIGPIRFREFVAALGKTPQRTTTGANSIFSLLFLDPLAGMDPTTAALEEARHLAERAMYYTQRMPTMLNWQTESLAYQLAVQPEARQILSNTERLVATAQTFAKTAHELPKFLNDQREATVRQLFEGLALERTNFLASLVSEEQKVRGLLAETRETLNAGSGLTESVHATIKSLDEFIRFVSPATNQMAASTNARPFDVLDYGKAANEIQAAANDLNFLLASLNESAPQLAQFRQQTVADAERVIRHAFWLALAFVPILLIASLLTGLSYRALAKKLARKQGKDSAVGS